MAEPVVTSARPAAMQFHVVLRNSSWRLGLGGPTCRAHMPAWSEIRVTSLPELHAATPKPQVHSRAQ